MGSVRAGRRKASQHALKKRKLNLEETKMNPLNMNPFEQAFWLVIFSGIWALGFCGMTVIGVLGKIIEWFA